MRIILSPAKKMKNESDLLAPVGLPAFLDNTRVILDWLRAKSEDELKNLWGCNDKITAENIKRINAMNLESNLSPAILAYEGIAYQYMAPAVFEGAQLEYVQKNLRILSAFYGVVRPMDGVTPYRLEMQAKASIGGAKNLYDFWGDSIYEQVVDDTGIIVNLASKEYSKCVEKYLKPENIFITCDFVEEVKGKLVTKGTYAKMARGEMVRYMAENNIEDVNEIKGFNRLGYIFRADLSDEKNFIFERKEV